MPHRSFLSVLLVLATAAYATETVWVDDAIPSGAVAGSSGGDSWNWVSSSPAPLSGSLAHQSALVRNRLHEHFFSGATTSLEVRTGDLLFAHIYLDPANPPAEVMLAWHDGTDWEHRAYWGANRINKGTNNTASRYFAGALPPAGQWVRLEVPAAAVGLEGRTINGMRFMLYSGRATWDRSGMKTATARVAKPGFTPAPGEYSSAQSVAISTTTAGANIRYTTDGSTPTSSSGILYTEPVSVAGSTTLAAIAYASGMADSDVATGLYTILAAEEPPSSIASGENNVFRLPRVGDNRLSILSSNLLELRRITTKEPDPATVTEWNFVSSAGTLTAPDASKFAVTVNGQTMAVTGVDFRRRAAYAPLNQRDVRIDNCLYLTLAGTVPDGATVEVRNPDGTLWPSTMIFKDAAHPLRYSPAIHVNQEGYAPSLPKKAMVGYYLGSAGEMTIDASAGFFLVDAVTGVTVHTGLLTERRDAGFTYAPLPYQKVFEADFSGFTAGGEYQLAVPRLGASLPFLINEGVAMAFTRTYAAGVYHQRCGAACAMPYSRFTHEACHLAAAEVPSPQSSYSFTWNTIASKNADAKNNPRHTAPQLKDEASQLYPFVHKGTVSVIGGHHDAGDYSKYTTNAAMLVHLLGFSADSIAGAGLLDNLGLPESGDGISDLLQEARHEADFLARMQDADGGFYFLVYPKTREYESDVTPDKGDAQVVWPKNTAATAASVAALAQMASSPRFKAAYPAEAAAYLNKALLGWQFLLNAIARHGKDGSYQKITHYGDLFMHDDELAWAAAAMFAATGESQYHQKLVEWFPDPGDQNTFRWQWWRMSESWGAAIRSYAFAARSGRLPAGALDPAYLGRCEEQIRLAANDALKWSNQNAYGSSFPEESKRHLGAGWYFSLDQAYDMAVGYQLDPRPEYIDALVANMNYEGGTNPVNVTFVSGLGFKRQRELVHQWANNDHRKMPMAGIPAGNITSAYNYGSAGDELTKLSYPTDDTTKTGNLYPFYDRWADTWNVRAEFVALNQARALGSLTTVAAQTSGVSGAWKPSSPVSIIAPESKVPLGEPVTLAIDPGSLDLAGARILWEARDQEPDFGSSYTVVPKNHGTQWVEVEITWPDGRRLSGVTSFEAHVPVLIWVDDAVPAGATLGTYRGDSWTWVTSNPPPHSGMQSHQTSKGTGLREHFFTGASVPMPVGKGDVLFTWVYLDPGAPTDEIMLHWNDGTWEHRAYWGANKISYGIDGTASRRHMGPLPPFGQWVKLEVPASAVALEDRNVTGMSFSAYNGKVTWDTSGREAAP
jgi:hypothetical protein